MLQLAWPIDEGRDKPESIYGPTFFASVIGEVWDIIATVEILCLLTARRMGKQTWIDAYSFGSPRAFKMLVGSDYTISRTEREF